MKANKILYILLAALSAVSSCKKFIEVEPPVDRPITAEVFSNDDAATSAVRGIYANIVQTNLAIANGGLSILSGLSADEIVNTAASTTYTPFATNSLLATDSRVTSNYWRRAYNYIYHSNSIIEGLENADKLTDSVRKQLL